MDVTKIKKIDIHAHAVLFKEFFPPHWIKEEERVMVSAEEVIDFYDRLGIEKGVLLPISSPEAQMSVLSSESCKYLSDKYPERFAWFCDVDPRAGGNKVDGELIRLIAHYQKLGAKGVGEITCLLPADHPKVMNLFAACAACDMPALIHINTTLESGYGIYDELGLPRLETVLKTFPDLKLIGHSQAFWSEISGDNTEELRGKYPKGPVQPGGRLVELMRKYSNLYCDLSAGSGHNAILRDPEFGLAFLEEFQDRIMYGCDICHTNNAHPFKLKAFLEEMLEAGKLSQEVYRKVVRENAVRILKLEEIE